ncbi:MAG: DUF421 domain-containing protein [Bacteroidales bacterium]
MDTYFGTTLGALVAIILTAAGIYAAVIIFTRLSGKRSFSTMSSFDFTMTVAVGSLIATTVLSSSVTLVQGVIGLGALFVLQISVAYLRLNTSFQQIVDNSPLLLMRNGKILRENLKRARLTDGDLRSKLRAAGVLRLSEVEAVVFETTGDLSIMKKSDENLRLEEWLISDVKR